MHIYATRSFNKPCNGASEPNEYIYDATAQRIRTSKLGGNHISAVLAARCTTVPYRTTIAYTSCDICHHDVSISSSPPHATRLIPTRNIKYATVLLQVYSLCQ